MYIDVPQLKRCCLCIPLRHGLLTWGYIKLISSLLVMVLTALVITDASTFPIQCIMGILLSAIILDFKFNILFLIGGHMKSYKLLNIFYYYSIVIFVTVIISLISLLGYFIYTTSFCQRYCNYIFGLLVILAVAVVGIQILLQFYLILLVRSEILKLKNNRSFIFVNVSASEAACTMSASEKEVQEKVKYDRLEEDAELAGVYNACQQAI